jgi:hypothetical protein
LTAGRLLMIMLCVGDCTEIDWSAPDSSGLSLQRAP